MGLGSLLGRDVLHGLDLAVAHPDHAVGEGLVRQLVGHHHQRQLVLWCDTSATRHTTHDNNGACLDVEVGEELHGNDGVDGVQVARGLVQQEDVGLVRD